MSDLRIGDEVAVVGIGQTEFVRRSTRPAADLIVEAVLKAVDDAGLRPEDVDGIVTEGELVPALMSDHDLVTNLGLRNDVFSARTGVGGPGIVTTPLLAALALKHGLATTVVSYFGIDWGRSAGAYAFHGHDPLKASLEMPFGFYGQPVYFAGIAQRYMHEYGLTTDELASVALSSRAWAQLNPDAQQRRPLDLAGYYESPMVADPLRVADCCLLTDGAAAFVMTTPERARDLRHPPVSVAAVERSLPATSLHSFMTQSPDLLTSEIARSGPRAMAAAGVGPRDVDLVNIYDCFSISCLIQFEDLGLCERGEAGSVFAAGDTAPGGRIPVNPHGGLMSEAYLHGINNVLEGVRQIRGEAGARQIPGAEVALISAYEQAAVVLTAAR